MAPVGFLGILALCATKPASPAPASPAPAAPGRAAPEFPRVDAAGWINSSPLSMRALRGQVVVLDIWTFG